MPTWMPDGRYLRSVISPTGSGSAAMASSPSAIAAIVCGVERQAVDERGVVAGGRRGGDVLGVGGDERRLRRARIAAAIASSAAFFARVSARASSRAAARAAAPTPCM